MTLTVRHGLKRDGSIGDVKNDGSRRQLPLPESVVPSLKAREHRSEGRPAGGGGVLAERRPTSSSRRNTGRPVSDRNLARPATSPTSARRPGCGDVAPCTKCRHTAATLALANRGPDRGRGEDPGAPVHPPDGRHVRASAAPPARGRGRPHRRGTWGDQWGHLTSQGDYTGVS